MARETPNEVQGELQRELMHILWRTERASVDQVRHELPRRFRRSAYTTIQTVLNRLAERGLLKRERVGKVIFYSPKISEAEYYSRSLRRALAPLSDQARRTVLAQLVGELDRDDLDEIESLAREVARRRRRRK